jgi:hypothetical protein
MATMPRRQGNEKFSYIRMYINTYLHTYVHRNFVDSGIHAFKLRSIFSLWDTDIWLCFVPAG